MRKDMPDNEIDGQMHIDDIFEPPEKLFAVSKIFARVRKNMTLAEQKAFSCALTEIKFTEEMKTNVVSLDKKVLANILDLKSDIDHLSVNLYKAIKGITTHSYIEINAKDLDFQSSGYVISNITRNKDNIELEFSQKYIGLFSGLTKDYNFITMWSSDIFKMQSVRSIQFYEHLRLLTTPKESVNNALLGVKALKELFDIPESGKNSYMRKDGHFDRPAFEKRIIEPIVEDLRSCKMITLLVQPDGKFYVKEKNGNRVTGYRFFWTYTSRPAIATAAEVKQIQERVDADPRVLKVAKDIVDDKKKPKKTKKNDFSDFSQREYDYAALESALLKADYNHEE